MLHCISLGINCIVRSFQWIGVVLDNSNNACDPTKTEYFLRVSENDLGKVGNSGI